MSITIVGGGNPSAPTFPVQRSVRLRSSASAYFNRTMTTPTNQKIWTWSGWVKIGAYTTSYDPIFAAGGSGSAYSAIWFNSNSLVIYSYNGATAYWLQTTQVFRDYSGWYHITVAVDTTQATSTNRIKLYINGIQVTAFSTSTYPSLNYNDYINSAVAHYIGQFTPALGSIYFDGYLTEVNFVDGQALTPTSFGAYNNYGVWSPAKYTGTYGTNGFYLNFQDNSAATAAAIGKDSSGNGNNWTPNNISVTAGVTYDSMLDVPTLTSNTNANFCTLNPLNKGTPSAGTGTMSAGNLNWNCNNNSATAVATMAIPTTGKWYWEAVVTTQTYNFCMVGVLKNPELLSNLNSALGILSTGYAVYASNGQKYNNAANAIYMAAPSQNTVITIAFDADNGNFYVGAGGNWANGSGSTNQAWATAVAAYTGLTSSTGTYYPAISFDTGNVDINFGQRPFTYTPPSGFKRLNTYNLPAPTIPNGAAYMAASLYTGTGAAQSITNTVNGVSMQPDFVWMKQRSAINDHILMDSVRGVTKAVFSNLTNAEVTDATRLTSFNSNGFTLGTSASTNTNAGTYVGWQWKANGTPATTIVGGTIPSVISVNTTAGFSVVTYTGNGTGALASVGHGLGIAPKMIILKNRGSVTNWPVYHANLTSAAYTVFLNATNAQAADIGYWGSTPPDSGQFYIYGTSGSYTNISGATYVAYCWAEIPGFSKFGSYTGNGSTDGPFVYCGFRPRFILVKASNSATSGWEIIDTARNPYNEVTYTLRPNTSAAELVAASFPDILSNGFKPRSTNGYFNDAGNTYIFAAFAENPFNYSLAR